MTAVAETYLDETAEAYRDDVVAAIAAHVEVLASFVLGSGLVGGYRPGESDLDLVVVVDAPLRGEARRTAIERIGTPLDPRPLNAGQPTSTNASAAAAATAITLHHARVNRGHG